MRRGLGVLHSSTKRYTTDFIPPNIAPRVRQLLNSFRTLDDLFAIAAVSCQYVEAVESVLINFEPEPEPAPLEHLFPSVEERDVYHGDARRR